MPFRPDPKPVQVTKNNTKCKVTGCSKIATEKHGEIDVCSSHLKRLNAKPVKSNRKKGIRKNSNKPFPKAKKKAKAIFQKWVRLRDSDKDGICRCICCKKPYKWEGGAMHGGHYHSAENSFYLLFDEQNVNAQCRKCNKSMGTPEVVENYQKGIVEKYGTQTLERLDKEKNYPVSHDTIYMMAIAKKYTDKFDELKEQKGI